MDNVELISLYENVAQITAHMLDAAQNGDWELLSDLENNCKNTVETLQMHDISSELTLDLKNKKIAIIKKILEDDRKIRDITEPWMIKLSNLMKKSQNHRQLSQAYGANQIS